MYMYAIQTYVPDSQKNVHDIQMHVNSIHTCVYGIHTYVDEIQMYMYVHTAEVTWQTRLLVKYLGFRG